MSGRKEYIMICNKCGNENLDTASFCAKCGAPLAQAAPSPTTAQQPPQQVPSFLQKFLNEQQDPTIVQRVHQKVSQILTSGEEINYIAVQNKPVLNISPDCVVLTNKRFIIYKPKMLGRVSFEDYIWRDLRDARLKEGIMGATLTMLTIHNRRIMVDYLPKAQARRLYAFAQEMEEQVLEERRIRAMEEQRAAAGGITIQGGPMAAQAQAAPAQVDPVQKLQQLKQMMDGGLITSEEYEAKKTDILSRM
ncbi:MAG: zinc-ribbon domain-containing protein [Anaerolineales bacterium]|nr:MAG: zinc-ribbon domain-containing protein [Anaerolineales bacterium]